METLAERMPGDTPTRLTCPLVSTYLRPSTSAGQRKLIMKRRRSFNTHN